MIADDTTPVRERTAELRYLCLQQILFRFVSGGLGKVAQVSIFWIGGVGFFGTVDFADIMDRFVRRLALAGVLQREQAAYSS